MHSTDSASQTIEAKSETWNRQLLQALPAGPTDQSARAEHSVAPTESAESQFISHGPHTGIESQDEDDDDDAGYSNNNIKRSRGRKVGEVSMQGQLKP